VKRQLFLTTALGALLLTACENKNKETASRVDEPYVPLDQMETAPAEKPMTTSGAETQPPAGTAADYKPSRSGAAAADEVLAPTDETGGQTYVVQKGDTLCSLARKFYGDQARWKDIWEANRARLSDPDKLSVGMKLIIP
jgi:nucleoid-associated protein YgaU